jgi:hypothetical protein
VTKTPISPRELSALDGPKRVASIKAGMEGKIVRHGPGYWEQRLKELNA